MLSEDMGYGSCQAGSRHRDRPIRAARKLQKARTDPGILLPSGALGTDATFDRQHVDEAGSSELQTAAARVNVVTSKRRRHVYARCSASAASAALLQLLRPRGCESSASNQVETKGSQQIKV